MSLLLEFALTHFFHFVQIFRYFRIGGVRIKDYVAIDRTYIPFFQVHTWCMFSHAAPQNVAYSKCLAALNPKSGTLLPSGWVQGEIRFSIAKVQQPSDIYCCSFAWRQHPSPFLPLLPSCLGKKWKICLRWSGYQMPEACKKACNSVQ